MRDEKDFFKGIASPRVPKEMVDLARHILSKKAGHFDPRQFKDEYELALRKLVKRKASGKVIERPKPEERGSNVIDLMEALRQSVKGRSKAAALRSSSPSKKSKSSPTPRKARKVG